MRAAILERYGEPLVIRDVDPPGPDANGVVVRVEA
jgi:Zn-dependent alcohol dehydrogenase